jgi:Protein of unknown function (DUF3638)
MISPASGRNVSLQFNIGEGKSSVIAPLVASTLANGSNPVRVVTLKLHSSEMFQLLVSRLSGLANRPIFYVPFMEGGENMVGAPAFGSTTEASLFDSITWRIHCPFSQIPITKMRLTDTRTDSNPYASVVSRRMLQTRCARLVPHRRQIRVVICFI